jgi:rhodanese-related sulfurtransferase
VNFLFENNNWVFLLMALTSGGLLLWPAVQRNRGGAHSVNTTEAVRLINREKGVLVDVSEPAEYADGHAAGARNVPFGQLEAATGNKALPTNKGLPLLLLCATGARAGRAVNVLRKAGYEKAVAVQGGTRAWREANLPIEKGDAPADKGQKALKA